MTAEQPKRRRGRPRKPIELHLLAGTFRRDRHGPRPGPSQIGSAVAPALVATGAPPVSGAALVASIRSIWAVDDLLASSHLQALSIAQDRCVALDAALDGPAGLLAKLAAGQVAASAVNVLLRARRDAAGQVAAAMAALDLEAAPAIGRARPAEAS